MTMKMLCLLHKCFILHPYEFPYWIQICFVRIKKIIGIDDMTLYPSGVPPGTVRYMEVSVDGPKTSMATATPTQNEIG